jgi:protein-tyrosine phosphatase
MIDLNCHILDGTGCGPESFAESLEMCRLASESGVRTIVATLRWQAGRVEPPLPFDEVDRKIERLRAETRGSLFFKSGFTFEFSSNLPELINRYGARVTIGGNRHLLVSLPSTGVPAEAGDVWSALAQLGFFIIIAHPECSPMVRRNPALLPEWSSQGVKFQLDAASLTGAYGREVRNFAVECLKRFEEEVVVASNAKNARTNPLKKVRAELVNLVGDRRTTKCVRGIPRAIIGDTVPQTNGGRRNVLRGISSLFRLVPSGQSAD